MDAHDYPGVMVTDEKRTAFGLGWEYRRRGWPLERCPFDNDEARAEFADGWHQFKCCDPKINAAMLRDIPQEERAA